MSIAKAFSNFLHRAKTDAATTEAEITKVIEAVQPKVVELKNAVVDEVRDDLAKAVTDAKDSMSGALSILAHDHATNLSQAAQELDAKAAEAIAAVHKRFDALDAKVAEIKASFEGKTGTATTAKKAAPAAKKAADAPAAVVPADTAAPADAQK